MIKTFLFVVAIVFSLTSLTFAESAGPAQPPASSGWSVQTLGKTGRFQVSLPAAPEEAELALGKEALNAKATMYSVESDEMFLIIADLYNLPVKTSALSQKDKLELMKAVREGMIEGIQEEFKKESIDIELTFGDLRNVTVNGLSGFEQDVQLGPFGGRARLLTADSHVYIFFSILIDEDKASEMETFYSSFKFLRAR